MEQENNPEQKCPQCGKPIEVQAPRKIFLRLWDPIRRKQYAGDKQMVFCSELCGGHYQMGCEG